jgi:hypothetical protein
MTFISIQELADSSLIPSGQLPDVIAGALGRCIASHSLLETTLSLTLYALVEVNPKVGRIAVGNPRTAQLLDRMQQVIEARGLQLPDVPWKEFRKTLDDLKTRRDLFAHSPWGMDSDAKFVLFVTSGSGQLDGRNRRLYPEGLLVTPSMLVGLHGDIGKAIAQAQELDRLVRTALHEHASSSPHIPP